MGLSSGKVILSTVPTNLKSCAPFASQHGPALGKEELQQWQAFFDEGRKAQEARRWPKALRQYGKAEKIDDRYAELAFRMGRCAEQLGAIDDAKRYYRRARDLDTLRFRADSRINGVVRELAEAQAANTAALVAVITTLGQEIARLEAELVEAFGRHPDAEILRSLPGLGDILGARVLAEFGDAPDRYLDATARRDYAGTAPITRASGTSRLVVARLARNKRLFDAAYQWAFCALTNSPGARAYYDDHDPGPRTSKVARRKLANKLVGILHGCLAHRTAYDEDLAWSRPEERLAA